MPIPLASAQLKAFIAGTSGSSDSGGFSSPVTRVHTPVTSFWARKVPSAPAMPAYTFQRIFSETFMEPIVFTSGRTPPGTGPRTGEETDMNPEPTSGPLYSERLWMPWWWWLIIGFFALSLVVAILAWVDSAPGVVAAALLCALCVAGILAAGWTHVSADESGLSVGPNRIEWLWVDRVRACDAATMQTILHSGHQVGSFIATRPWIGSGVVVRLADPADPHPAWIVSSRHPERLAAVIRDRIAAQRAAAGKVER